MSFGRPFSGWRLLPHAGAVAAGVVALSTMHVGAQQQIQPLAPGQQEAQRPPGAAPAAQDGTGERPASDCGSLPDHAALTEALRSVVAPGEPEANGGLGNHMWATVVDRSGVICAITRSGENPGDQWPGSRAVSAQKAFTANAFSLPEFSLSTANLYWPAQPGSSLYGLPTAAPVAPGILEGDAPQWGTPEDLATGERLGGTTVFGGGLALYSPEGELIGGLGISGDQSCTDHVVAWKVRHTLNLDNVPDGVSDQDDDNIIHDITTDPASGQDESPSGFGHPTCSPTAETIAENLSRTHPVGVD